MHTTDFEFLLELDNVRAVDWNEEEQRVDVRVSKKVPVEDLAEGMNIEEVVDHEVNVIDEDEEPDEDAAYDFLQDPKEKHRPVQEGVSEIHYDSTAATAGNFRAKVVDTSKANWADFIDEGDIVRTSNNHVYAKINQGEFGDEIWQPSPRDGGTEADVTGVLAGYVTIEDGVTVDVAARTTDRVEESTYPFGLDKGYGTSIYRGDFSGKRGSVLTKTGRTTGVTTGAIQNTSASLRVRMPGEGTVTFRDCVITENMASGGDSGSSAFFRETGEYCGKLFAGSPAATIFLKAKNEEKELGIEYLPGEGDEPDDPPEEDQPSLLCSILRMFGLDWLVRIFC